MTDPTEESKIPTLLNLPSLVRVALVVHPAQCKTTLETFRIKITASLTLLLVSRFEGFFEICRSLLIERAQKLQLKKGSG